MPLVIFHQTPTAIRPALKAHYFPGEGAPNLPAMWSESPRRRSMPPGRARLRREPYRASAEKVICRRAGEQCRTCCCPARAPGHLHARGPRRSNEPTRRALGSRKRPLVVPAIPRPPPISLLFIPATLPQIGRGQRAERALSAGGGGCDCPIPREKLRGRDTEEAGQEGA